MNHFKDFTIKRKEPVFAGDKIKMKNILNIPIEILKFKIGPSKFDGIRLDMQIKIKDELRLAWTNSSYLMNDIVQVPEDGFPFKTTIVLDGEAFIFT